MMQTGIARLCTRCVLPETFPGIYFNTQGLCNYCSEAQSTEQAVAHRAGVRGKFLQLLDEVRDRGAYDVLVSWSGGKDSTYILARLVKEFNVRALAFTFDNGFLSRQAFSNMEKLAESLGVDHLIYKPRLEVLRTLFNAAAAGEELYPTPVQGQVSNLCITCMGLERSLALRLAIEKNIPILTDEGTPGQAPPATGIRKRSPAAIRKMQERSMVALRPLVGDALRPTFLEEEHYCHPERFPYHITPFAMLEYDETEIYSYIEALGWIRPRDTDIHSTNCLLNSYGIFVHLAQTGFHPYAAELASQVREGRISREEALVRLGRLPNRDIVNYVTDRLGVFPVAQRITKA